MENKNKKLNKSTAWDAKIDKRLAEIKAAAKKNGNHMIFVVTSEGFKNNKGQGTKVTGLMVSHMFSVTKGIETFLSGVPDEAVQMVMMKKSLGGIAELLSRKVNKKQKNG